MYSLVWISYIFLINYWDSAPILASCGSRPPNFFLLFGHITSTFASKLEAISEYSPPPPPPPPPPPRGRIKVESLQLLNAYAVFSHGLTHYQKEEKHEEVDRVSVLTTGVITNHVIMKHAEFKLTKTLYVNRSLLRSILHLAS